MHEAMLDIGLVDDALRNTIASAHEPLLQLVNAVIRFLQPDAMHKRCLYRHAVSVCLCVCLSRSWIVSIQIKISSKFFHHRVATAF